VTTLLQIADAHLRADGEQIYGRDPERNLAVVVAACARELPGADAVVLSGDQSDDAELAALERAKEMIAPLGASVLAIPGNHDGPELQRAVFGARASADVGRWRVVAIDSSIPGEIHGSVDVAAAERLLDALDARPTVLAIHHPPLAPTTHPWFQLEHAQALLASLTARPHVRADPRRAAAARCALHARAVQFRRRRAHGRRRGRARRSRAAARRRRVV